MSKTTLGMFAPPRRSDSQQREAVGSACDDTQHGELTGSLCQHSSACTFHVGLAGIKKIDHRLAVAKVAEVFSQPYP